MRETKTYCFISNYLTPHQLPFCLAMKKETSDNFVFIETEALPEERKRLGYPSLGEKYAFVLNASKSEENKQRALTLAVECDVVIIGSAPDIYIKKRLQENKLTFRFSERIFKKRYFDPLRWVKYTLKNFKYRNKNLFFLLSSAYAPHDYKRCGIKEEKMFKWGYFPDVGQEIPSEISKEPNKCVWVGRFLNWKHPDLAVNTVIHLRDEGYNVSLDLVGSGEMGAELEAIVKENNAEEYIRFVGNQPYEKVREYMSKAEVFLFTSDYNEGWGAVLNEAMDSRGVVVASHAAGSVPFLIRDGKNGFIYHSCNQDQLFEKLRNILDKKVETEKIADLARETVIAEWNAENATKKMIAFCEAFFAGDYKTGICEEGVLSLAKAIPQKDMYNYMTREI
jgi:glycosyltransferase involved in cell wall biosynthesis